MRDAVAREEGPKFSVPAKPKADGTFVASVKADRGTWRDVRVPKSVGTSHRAAEKWVATNYDALARGASARELVAAPPPPAVRTFTELGPEILDARDKDVDAKKLAAATRGEFKTHWSVHIEPFFGAMHPHEVKTTHLLRFRDELAKTKEPRTVRNIFKNVSILFKVVIGRGLDPKLKVHPLRHAVEHEGFSLPTAEDGPIAFLSREDAAKLLLCRGIPEHRRARYALGFLSGMRDGEIAGAHLGRPRPRRQDRERDQGPAEERRDEQDEDAGEQPRDPAPRAGGPVPRALEGRVVAVRRLDAAPEGPRLSERARRAPSAEEPRDPARGPLETRARNGGRRRGHRLPFAQEELLDLARGARRLSRDDRPAARARAAERPAEALLGGDARAAPGGAREASFAASG